MGTAGKNNRGNRVFRRVHGEYVIGSYLQYSTGNSRYFQPPYRPLISDYVLLQYNSDTIDIRIQINFDEREKRAQQNDGQITLILQRRTRLLP